MRPDIAAADRAKDIRDAAKAWARAGLAASDVAQRVNTLYPDDRQRFGPGFRVVAFVFAWMAGWSCMGFFFMPFAMVGSESWGLMMLMWGGALAFVTEYQRGPLKRADAGAESATGLMAAGFVLAGSVGLLEQVLDRPGNPEALVIPALATTIAATAAFRWAERIYFLAAMVGIYVLLAQTFFGRAAWVVASVALISWGLGAARSERHAPSHRAGARIVAACAILALYASVHVWSFDHRIIEEMNAFGRRGAASLVWPPMRSFAILATGLMPVALIVAGWRRRETLLIHLGLVLTLASIASIRLYQSLLPLWLALILVGAVCLGLALGLRRWLRSGDDGECYGFTADPLLDDQNRTAVIQAATIAASFTPAATTPQSGPSFEGKGGGFGGGGATSTF